MSDTNQLLNQHSFVELSARQRIKALLDVGSMRELLGPFDRIKSPWLGLQGIVAQADDGVVVAKGSIAGKAVVVAAIEGDFQGGSMGEVSGAKIATALQLALEDNRAGTPRAAVLLLETGGVRLQEANLGLAAIADIHSAIVELRAYQPVIGVVAGSVGCFGGMSIAAALCSDLLVTREARVGLNGPQVIEQEAGLEEYDSRDRPFIWSFTGGQQRYTSGLADEFCHDSVEVIKDKIAHLVQSERPRFRSDQYEYFLTQLYQAGPEQATPERVRELYTNLEEQLL
jgi:malonate decarboxylase beta subunit